MLGPSAKRLLQSNPFLMSVWSAFSILRWTSKEGPSWFQEGPFFLADVHPTHDTRSGQFGRRTVHFQTTFRLPDLAGSGRQSTIVIRKFVLRE